MKYDDKNMRYLLIIYRMNVTVILYNKLLE
jgi:hypothetical protein